MAVDTLKPVKPTYSQKVIPLAFDESMSYLEDVCNLKYKINEIIGFIDDVLEDKINDYINEKFNNMIIDTMYNAQTETLVLYLHNVEGGE